MRIKIIEVRDIPEDILHEVKPDFIGSPEDLDSVIAQSDVLSLHLPLTEETRHVISARRLALMKPNAYLINVARGALVDEEALSKILLNGGLGGAGLMFLRGTAKCREGNLSITKCGMYASYCLNE